MNNLYFRITNDGLQYLKTICSAKATDRILIEFSCLDTLRLYGILNYDAFSKINYYSIEKIKPILNDLKNGGYIKAVIINDEIFEKIVLLQGLI